MHKETCLLVNGYLQFWDIVTSLAAGDFNGDGSTDLAIGVPQDFIANHDFGAAVNILYGSSTTGLEATNDQLWHQDRSGVEDSVEDTDYFGQSVSKEEPAAD